MMGVDVETEKEDQLSTILARSKTHGRKASATFDRGSMVLGSHGRTGRRHRRRVRRVLTRLRLPTDLNRRQPAANNTLAVCVFISCI